jgi:hypothetical protein
LLAGRGKYRHHNQRAGPQPPSGGEFAEHWDELNLLEVFQQLGVIPAIGPGGM